MMDQKLVLMVAGAIVLCAFVGGLLIGLGGHETDDAGDLSPPPLPEGDQTATPALPEDNGTGLFDLFGDDDGIEPPSLP